ncbi:MAG: phenylalanine--tRNA ligase subunit beta [bacterium]|nr:phenylalanine--tRNA ligase subunit beta [bacterium]
MKISLDWLGDFITFTESDTQKIAAAITAHIAEIDEVEVQGALLEHCCVGKILSLTKHPGADRLSLCQVQTDKGLKAVVCGGGNLREGMRVAFAHVGAKVSWHGEEMVTLEKTKIRGEESEGMICAASELGLEVQFPMTDEKDVIDMGDNDEGVGQDLRSYLGLTDTVLHIDNHAITHRADLFSHASFARECVAIKVATWKNKPSYNTPGFTSATLPFKIKVDCPKLVPRYNCCTLSIDSIGETPDWMKRRLEATGWRSVSLPVDITNYVSMEVGMPLHSFDLDDLQGDVHIRLSKKGEKIRTLDDIDRDLPEGSIILNDDLGIFDLLGVMGGLRSSTKESTKRVFLHSAVLDPVSIRRTIIATGHRTDASTVYEKGIPNVASPRGFYRALSLFLELVPGAKITSAEDSWGDDGTAEPIALSCDRVRSMLGIDIDDKRIQEILESLEFTVQFGTHNLSVTPPLDRLGDISGAHDLIEEVARIYGLDNIEPVMPAESIATPERDFRLGTIRDGLKERKYMEFLPLCMMGPDLLKKCEMDPANAAEIENPIGEELSLLQPCVLPKLLEQAQLHAEQTRDDLQIFHVGTIFEKTKDNCLALGMLRTGESAFLELKRDLSMALEDAGYSFALTPSKTVNPAAHTSRCSDIMVGKEALGKLFELHPKVSARFDLPKETAIVLFNCTGLLTTPPTLKVAKPIPQFPAVKYDVTITVDASKPIGPVLDKARGSDTLVETIDIIDLYKQNLTLRCTYRAADKTLKEDEAKKAHEKVVKMLEK